MKVIKKGNNETKVLIIGGAGYIGNRATRFFLDKGYFVRVLDILFFNYECFKDIIDHPRFELVEGDIRNLETLIYCMKGIDIIIHLAAIVGNPACEVAPDYTTEVNLTATKNMIFLANKSNIKRLIFASTCSIYGKAKSDLVSESSEPNPVSIYAKTKLLSEKIILECSFYQDLTPVILRFGTVFGLSERLRFDLVVNLLTKKAVKEGEISIYSGEQWRPFVHVDDVVEAIYRASTYPESYVEYETFNVGSDSHNLQIKDLGKIFKMIFPNLKINYVKDKEDERSYRVDFSKIKMELGFNPKKNIISGIRQLKEFIENNPNLKLDEKKYSNLSSISQIVSDVYHPLLTDDMLNEKNIKKIIKEIG